jgi:acetyltransferase-like isoleucine patch superfamily enzyme
VIPPRYLQPLCDRSEWERIASCDAWVHRTARVGEGCRFGPGVVVGPEVELGQGTTLGGHVRVDHGVVLGEQNELLDGVVVYPGTRLGNENRVLEHCHLGRGPEVAGPITRKLKRAYVPLTIGDRCLIGPSVKLYAGTRIGSRVSIFEFVTVREECAVGDDVVLAPGVTVNYETTIGARTRVMHSTHLTGGMTIEEDVFISLHVGSTNDSMIETVEDATREWRGATIRRGAVIGAGTMLSPNVEIGAGAHIGMQSVVTKDIPPHTLAAGAPARVVRSLEAK